MLAPRDFLAELSFRLRGLLRWSAPAWKRPIGSWSRALRALPEPARARAETLAARHDLTGWPRLLTALELRENLYLLDLLEQHLPTRPCRGAALEVGAKNGGVLPALHAAAPVPWDLVELDAHRRYLDLSTRRAHGEKMARHFAGCRYLSGSVTTLAGRYGLVVWILPFVHPGPLRAWGLPARFFAPETLLAHVVGLLDPGGQLFVVNQGERERDTQRALFAAVGGGDVEELGLLESPLSPFSRRRYGFRFTSRG